MNADRCAVCHRRRDVHGLNWFTLRHPFKEQENVLIDRDGRRCWIDLDGAPSVTILAPHQWKRVTDEA